MSVFIVCHWGITRRAASHCPKCNTRLQPRDIVPLFRYLCLGRKCRYCRTPISPRYFIIEFITGLLFTLFFFALVQRYPNDALSAPWWGLLILAWIFVAAMLVTFVIDMETTFVYRTGRRGSPWAPDYSSRLIIRCTPRHWRIPIISGSCPCPRHCRAW